MTQAKQTATENAELKASLKSVSEELEFVKNERSMFSHRAQELQLQVNYV